MKNYRYTIKNLECANCAKKIETKIANTEGYEDVILNFATQKLSFKTDKQKNVKEEIEQIISTIEPTAIIVDEKVPIKVESIKKDVIRLIVRKYIICNFNVYTNGKYIAYTNNIIIIWSTII